MRTKYIVGRALWALRIGLCVAWGGCAHVDSSEHPVSQQPAGEAEGLLRRAGELAARGQLVSAEQFLVAARDVGIPPRVVLPALVRVCLRSGRPTRAFEHIEEALRRDDADPTLWTLGAALAWGLGRHEDALRYAREADRLPGAPPETHYWRGRVAETEGRPLEARDHFRAYLASSPQGTFADGARYWLRVSGPAALGEAP